MCFAVEASYVEFGSGMLQIWNESGGALGIGVIGKISVRSAQMRLR
jgi:hypothetical protein